MAYLATLSNTQQLAIAARGSQTQISLTTSSQGQQQSQSSSFTTGEWNSKPRLFDLRDGFVLQIDAQNGTHYLQIQQNNIATISHPANLNDYPQIELQSIANRDRPLEFKPMSPMQPMQMGKMSMDLNSMSMQMGDMSLNLNSDTVKQFCSQCGTEAKAGDRFCRSCGHELAK